MSLMLLAEVEDAAKAAADLPVSPEQQESIISVLSVASSALLLIIIGGAGEKGQGKESRCRSVRMRYCCSCCVKSACSLLVYVSGRPAPQCSLPSAGVLNPNPLLNRKHR